MTADTGLQYKTHTSRRTATSPIRPFAQINLSIRKAAPSPKSSLEKLNVGGRIVKLKVHDGLEVWVLSMLPSSSMSVYVVPPNPPLSIAAGYHYFRRSTGRSGLMVAQPL